ncbi:hypothetical protein ABVK25_003202 [Lepraria finkii]|uniref:Copper transport protein n=1 Tax=Lepraria finkii TaxID=1340010 RepID=A0ABR4BH98_9LECA
MFVGSCIGVICLVLLLEFLRRLQREYDRFIACENQQRSPKPGNRSSDPEEPPHLAVPLLQDWAKSLPPRESGSLPSITQQTVRALMYMLQFAVAYMIMLLAMYYNGYIIVCIFIGAFIGFFLFSRDGFVSANNGALSDNVACCA